MDGDNFSLELCDDISRIAAAEWESVAGTENPFVCYAFLAALEAGKAVGGDTFGIRCIWSCAMIVAG